MICDYGCGQEAIHTFKSGRHCCATSTSKCPAMVSTNSDRIRSLRNGKGNSYWANGHPRGSKNGTSLKGKTYDEIYGEHATERRRRLSRGRKGHKSWDKVPAEAKARISGEQRRRILDRYENGWSPKAGRCKKIRYVSPIAGEVLLDGTWELAVAVYLDKMVWNWRRNTKRFSYINLKGKISHYTPDFWVEQLGGYLEVKGYETDLDRCKWAQFTESLTVWKKDAILQIMERGPDGKAAGC